MLYPELPEIVTVVPLILISKAAHGLKRVTPGTLSPPDKLRLPDPLRVAATDVPPYHANLKGSEGDGALLQRV